MADRREQILVRLLALGGALPGIATALRNEPAAEETRFPVFMLLDADEEADDSDPRPGGRATAPGVQRVTMTPEIFIVLQDLPEDVGTDLNGYRAALIKAVLDDATLQGLVGSNGSMRYAGMSTGLQLARGVVADMAILFSFTYPLIRSEL